MKLDIREDNQTEEVTEIIFGEEEALYKSTDSDEVLYIGQPNKKVAVQNR